jgi:hypothetical protein
MDLSDLLAWPDRADLPGMVFRRLLPRHAVHGLAALSRAEQVLWLVFELCREVSDGGVDQLLADGAGERVALAPAALRELGQPDLAGALERVLRRVPPGLAAGPVDLEASLRAELEAFGRSVEASADIVTDQLSRWIDGHRGDFEVANAGLAAFAPVRVRSTEPLDRVLRMGREQLVPALYARIVERPGGERTREERAFVLAAQAFGEISDEGGLSYLFCSQASHAAEAKSALVQMRASSAAQVVGRAMALLPSPYPVETGARRAALAALSDDVQTRLRALQWELDELRDPTLAALVEWVHEQRRSFR